VGSLILMATIVNDILFSNQIIQTFYVMPIGFFVFVFFQAFILSMKFSNSFYKAEFLGTALADTNRALRRFVPYEFLEFLEKKSIVDVKLGDQVQKEMCILFSDIRAFTSLSERLSPKENFNFLNSYLERIGPVIRAHGGFIDKYLGDGIMALFPDSADHALGAAVEMLRKVNEYNEHRGNSGYEPIGIGIAINLGHLMLGTIGESDRMDTTVISDAVNLASRMEGLSKLYGPGIIVSTMVMERLSDPAAWRFRRLGQVRVRGHREAVTLIQILNGQPTQLVEGLAALNEEWESGLAAYAAGDMPGAETVFARLAERLPAEPAISVYLRRARHWLTVGVPRSWDGIEDWSGDGVAGA
jgi:class 3 adenylate cyclase